MKYIWILLFLLCGCTNDNYDLNDYIEDTKELFFIDEIIVENELNQHLRCKQMMNILQDISHENLDYLLSYGLINEHMYKENVVISKEVATKMNQYVYDDLYQKQYVETSFNIGEVQQVEQNIKLDALKPGLYVQNNEFYEVLEDGEVKDYQINTFDLQSTFSPNLSSSILLPENALVDPLAKSMPNDFSVSQLRSRYFNFNLKGYKISGSVSSNNLQLNVSKKTNNDFKIVNELNISDLKCHTDISLSNHHFYFRLDYALDNSLKVSKTKTTSFKNKESIILEELKSKLKSINPSLPILEDELHLLSFQFEVPSTSKLVTIHMDVSLKMFVNGEAEIVIKSSNKQGAQSYQNNVQPLNQQKFEIEPHIEGNIECATVLNCDLKLGNIHIADASSHIGVGAEAISSIHYVDKKNKVIETEKSQLPYIELQNELNQYDLDRNSYVDLCQDVNIYYFGRIQANQKQSLLRKLGLYGSYTPLKKNISLLHIENHKEVDACTKNEILFNPDFEIESFDISNYQLYLSKGKYSQINASNNNCIFISSDNNVIEVDNTGRIYAKNTGHATIIVRDEDGLERRCLVIVQ